MQKATVLLFAALLGSLAPRLHAGEPEDATVVEARKLFEHGIHQEESGDWAGALVTFRKVALVRANHIVRFHVGLCLERTGKLVAARDEFVVARGLAEKEDTSDAKKTVAATTKHLTALEARIPRLRVARPPTPGATLSVDGTLVGSGVFDTQIPIDPGKHAIDVQAPGHQPFHADVVAQDGVTKPIEIAPVLTPLPAAPPPKKDDVTPPAPSRLPWLVVGVGVAGLAGAGVFYGLRARALSDVDATCNPGRVDCDPALSDTASRGKTYTLVGNVLLGVGATATLVGLGWWILQPSPRATVSVGAGPALGGAVVFGRF